MAHTSADTLERAIAAVAGPTNGGYITLAELRRMLEVTPMEGNISSSKQPTPGPVTGGSSLDQSRLTLEQVDALMMHFEAMALGTTGASAVQGDRKIQIKSVVAFLLRRSTVAPPSEGATALNKQLVFEARLSRQ